MFLKYVRAIFGNQQAPTTVHDPHQSFNGVTTHENGKYLYQSTQANWALTWGYADFSVLALWGTWAFVPGQSYTLLPALVSMAFIPRRWVQQRYFTWHAELLPHTEQVVFHKSNLFGSVSKHFVDIKNLEKVGPEVINNALMWSGNFYDQNMIFRDMESLEVFVFDKQGIWNQDALKHPLLY